MIVIATLAAKIQEALKTVPRLLGDPQHRFISSQKSRNEGGVIIGDGRLAHWAQVFGAHPCAKCGDGRAFALRFCWSRESIGCHELSGPVVERHRASERSRHPDAHRFLGHDKTHLFLRPGFTVKKYRRGHGDLLVIGIVTVDEPKKTQESRVIISVHWRGCHK